MIDSWVFSRRGDKGTAIRIGGLTVFKSYDTIVGFQDREGLKVMKNYWSTTTGAHLNALDGGDKKSRLSSDEFDAELEKAYERAGLKNKKINLTDALAGHFQQ